MIYFVNQSLNTYIYVLHLFDFFIRIRNETNNNIFIIVLHYLYEVT